MNCRLLDVVLLGPAATQYRDGLQSAFPDSIRFTPLNDGALDGHEASALAKADVLVSRVFPSRTPMPRLMLLQVPSAGYETIDFKKVPPRVTICNTYGHEQAIAEYVVHAAIGMLRGLRAQEASLRRCPANLQSLHDRPLPREFSGSRVGIIGLGHIGRAVAQLCAAFGCEIRVCSRRGPSEEPTLRTSAIRWHRLSDLDAFFEGLDVAVVSCPLTADTAGLVRRRHLEAMRAGVLVNIARAEIVVEEDLFSALSDHVLQGAVLDVWRSPVSEVARFADLDNVMMTPHVSAWTAPMRERRLAQIGFNLAAWRDGQPTMNVVRPSGP